MPDSQWTVSDLLADGDRVAARTSRVVKWAGLRRDFGVDMYVDGPFSGPCL